MTTLDSEIAKYGSLEAYQAEMRRRRSLVKNPGAFDKMSKDKHIEISRKGGKLRWKNAKPKGQDSATSQDDSEEPLEAGSED